MIDLILTYLDLDVVLDLDKPYSSERKPTDGKNVISTMNKGEL